MPFPPSQSPPRNYGTALQSLLHSDLHQSRSPDALLRSSLRRTRTIHDMRAYLRSINLPHTSTLHCRNVLHITGTKGKGSTAAMCESILRNKYGMKTGLFTSPHLVDIRERIRLNGRPVSREEFGTAYWTVRTRLERKWSVQEEDVLGSEDEEEMPRMPGYFRMLTLMALFLFAHHTFDGGGKVDVVILEVGMGGRYDATNVFDRVGTTVNTVCGVTLIDLDHTRVLGNTVERIAWEKGGIFAVEKGDVTKLTPRPDKQLKHEEQGQDMDFVPDEEAPELSSSVTSRKVRRLWALVSNKQSVLSVLRSCAMTEGCGEGLHISRIGKNIDSTWTIGLAGEHQRLNAELAIDMCESLIAGMDRSEELSKIGSQTGEEEDEAVRQALEETFWPGRCQSISIPCDASAVPNVAITLRCDGAHTTNSLETCMSWFRSVSGYDYDVVSRTDERKVGKMKNRILVFNCSHERNPVPLLQVIQAAGRGRIGGRSNNDCSVKKSSTTNREGGMDCGPLFDTVYFCRADWERPSMIDRPTAEELLCKAGVEMSAMYRGDNGTSVSNEEGINSQPVPTTWQETLSVVWKALEHQGEESGVLGSTEMGQDDQRVRQTKSCATVFVNSTVKDAVNRIKENAAKFVEECDWDIGAATETGTELEVEVCVTGSLYIVGSALETAGWEEEEANGRLNFEPI